MPRFPYSFSLSTGRGYYGPSLSDPRDQPEMWTTRSPVQQQSSSSLWWAAGGTAAVIGSGFIPFRGKNIWDRYVRGIRAVEEYSPGGILRTFQASTFLSQFASPAREAFFTIPERGYANYLAKLAGETVGGNIHTRILAEGIRFEGGRVYFGKGQDVLLKRASVLISPTSSKLDVSKWVGGELGAVGGKHYGSAYARSAGIELKHAYGYSKKDARLFGEIFQTTTGEFHRQIIGGGSTLQHVGRQIGGWGTEWVSRFNRLLETPFETPPFSTLFGGLQDTLKRATGHKLKFAVEYGPGLEMLGKLAFKYGVGAAVIGLGYKTLDYELRHSESLEGTTLGTGITGTLATGLVQANLLASKAADVVGLHSYREAQEQLAPGSTDLSKLLAFPLMGALGAAGVGYATQVTRMVQLQSELGIGSAAARSTAAAELASWGEKGTLSRIGKAITSEEGFYGRQDWIGSLVRSISRPSSKTGELSYKLIGKMTPTKLGALAGAGIGLALVAPFLPGALVPSQRPEELEAIYSGEKEIAIRKGRYWEAGRTPWEGTRIKYFRPHWYPRMMSRARDKALWGEDEPEPLEKLWKKEFTYEWTKEHYYDRPYPITSLPFEDIPLIGPLLAATIGRVIKPELLMHTDEWLNERGVQAMPPGFGERRAVEIGEQPPGQPISPYSLKGTIGEQAYRLTEMMGLPGFMMISAKEALTGSQDLYDQTMQLESARRAFGAERTYWDLEIGGGIGTTEALRRLYPHRRRQIPLYNPIRNTMPEWLPGPGEKSPDFLHGDPFTQVEEGEIRLPGIGYASMYPELEGVAPEDYPLIHRYKILGDIAPYTDKFKLIQQQVRAQRKLKTWTDYEEKIYKTTQEQVQQRKIKKEFDEYQYLSPTGNIFGDRRTYAEESSDLLATLNEMKASNQEKPGIFTRLFGGYWELLSHNAETALDVLTPISPGAKLVHQRTAIEDYHNSMVYGTDSSFWSHPIRDFIRPMLTRSAAAVGFDGIPEHVKDRRDLTEYFDILKYVKYSRLSNIARMSNDTEAAKEFESKKNETLFGINPFTYNYSHIFRALPRSERDYFNSFTAADSIEERAKILEMVPDNEKGLYVARWKLKLKDDIEKAKKADLLSEDQETEADAIIDQIYTEARAEGFPTSKELFAEYLATKLPGENYGDWYRRTRILPQIQLPGPDYVGFHPSVDLEDIKLKLVQTLGEDMHEYNLWESREQSLANKPYINQEALAPFLEPEDMSEEEMRARVDSLLAITGGKSEIFFRTSFGTKPSDMVEIEQDVNIEDTLEKML